MGSWIKGPYSLQECWSVGKTITADGASGLAITQTSAHTALSITQNGTVRALNVYTGVGATATLEAMQINIGSAAFTPAALKITNAGTGPDIALVGRPTAGIAAAAEGSIAYDTTLHKLRVRGAAGWETITSA